MRSGVAPLCPSRYPPQSVAACLSAWPGDPLRMGTKSRETIYGASVRAAAERATEARKQADRLAVEAWNKRMLGFQGPAQPRRAGRRNQCRVRLSRSEVPWLQHDQTVALDIVRRPKATPVHELERYMRCKDCSESGAIRTSGAIWWRCGRPRSRRAIRLRHGGRASDETSFDGTEANSFCCYDLRERKSLKPNGLT